MATREKIREDMARFSQLPLLDPNRSAGEKAIEIGLLLDIRDLLVSIAENTRSGIGKT